MRRLLASTAAVLALLAPLSCGDSSDSSDPGGDGDDATTTTSAVDDEAAPEGVEVEVLDPGAEPRVELRYAFVAGSTERFETTTVVDQSVDDTSPGPISTTIEATAEVLEASADDATVRVVYGTPVVTTSSEAPPEVVSGAERSAAAIAGASAELRVDGRGRVLDLDLELADDDDELAEQLRQGLEENLGSQGVALPAEAVGVGARWRVSTTTDAGGAVLVSEQVVTVTAIGDGAVDLAFTVAGTFEEGATGPTAGSGTLRVTFDEFFPELASTTTNDFTAQGTAVTQTVEQTIRRL